MSEIVRTRWSKPKREVESRFAESVAGRVSIFMTGYHGTHNESGGWAIRIDGIEVGGIGDRTSWQRYRGVARADRDAGLRGEGLHERDMVYRSLREYLSLSIDYALASPDALIRSLALLDHRTGKARLRKLITSPPDNPMERYCLEFRCDVEGIGQQKQSN